MSQHCHKFFKYLTQTLGILKAHIRKEGRHMKKLLAVLTLCTMFLLTACSSGYGGYEYSPDPNGDVDDSETYQEIVENPFVLTSEVATSQLSLTVNTGSYSNFRSAVNDHRFLYKDSLRVEEFINYFHYSYDDPTGDDVLGTHVEVFDTPWNSDTKLMMVGMKAKSVSSEYDGNNFVFLVDVSGSMDTDNKLGLVKQSLVTLVENLDDQDTISLVTYSSRTSVVFKGLAGEDKNQMISKINGLRASGSTNGSDGIERAYGIAADYFIEGGNNRIILCTDGDFNFGIVERGELEEFIIEKRASGIYFSVFGFGYGNLQDDNLETLARNGNGTYAYIDSELEANRAFSSGLDGTLFTVARDAKAQITFNENQISEYRLVGYEHGLLTEEEFDDSETDAGEIGSDLMVTVVFEIKFVESLGEEKLADLTIRYKSANTSDDTQFEQLSDIMPSVITGTPSEDALFITSLIETVLILRESDYMGDSSLASALSRIEHLPSVSDDIYKAEFVTLLEIVIQSEVTAH